VIDGIDASDGSCRVASSDVLAEGKDSTDAVVDHCTADEAGLQLGLEPWKAKAGSRAGVDCPLALVEGAAWVGFAGGWAH